MTYKNPKDFFVKLLSDVRQHEEGLTNSLNELREKAQDPYIKEYLESISYLSEKTVNTIDQCFKMIGEQPVKTDDKLQKLFLDDFRKEITEIQSPVVTTLFIAAKANHLMNHRAGEWITLIAMSDASGKRGVGLLLESCFAQKVAFVERARRRIKYLIQESKE